MRATIRGYRYDTAKAEAIYTYHYGSGAHHLVETLYRTPRGKLFLHGSGAAASRWAVRLGGVWHAGERLVAFEDKAQALAWLAAIGQRRVGKQLQKNPHEKRFGMPE